MTGAVIKIKTRFPERSPGEGIQHDAIRTFGKPGAGEGNMAFQNTGEGRHRIGRRWSAIHQNGAGDVGRPV